MALGERGVADWATRAEALERWLLRMPDVVVTTSDGAAAEVGELLPQAEVAVVPLSAEPAGPARRGGRAGVALLVDVHRTADLDAAQWLCREVMPRARMANRELVAVIVGEPTAPPLRALAGPGVQVVPPDTAGSALQRAVVAAAPWRYGSGMQQWALDALAAGVPLAATRVGSEGLGVQPGRDALIADDADGLARAIVSVAGDVRLWGEISAAGQDHVRERDFTPGGLVERLRSIAVGGGTERAAN
jgi:glycosyltransferase involved in cell wall biosynthesis